ncbi:MAG: hypothetical protein JWO05_2497 [Gemmatimonadetes bacterium]|nr:hypothetical protein [Gemmatimonadota bacterium]
MSTETRQLAENAIEQLLLLKWDPLAVRESPGEHLEYQPYAHEVYALLARGASDTQIARFLHRAEAGELNHPELVEQDLTPLVREVRALERSLGSMAR